MNVDIILCTKDRPSAITSLLYNISTLASLEYAKITVVDASQSSAEVNYEQFSELFTIQVIRSAPGLPTQRNLGLKATVNPIIVFLDDDVVLPQNFISATLSEFSKDDDIAGVGYLLKGVEFHDKKLLKCISVRLNGRHFGQVSKSGLNYWYPEVGNKLNFRPPMWLPGCAMAFRRSQITGMLFNPVLEKGILGGYALGEDVDFTLALVANGKKLALTLDAIVDHYEAPGERDNRHQLARAQGDWLKYLAKSQNQYISSSRIFSRLILEFLYLHVFMFIGRGNTSARVCARKRLTGFLSSSPYSSQN
jgi:GT2 family glycosyltransferase